MSERECVCVLAKTPGLYQVTKLRNLNLIFFLHFGRREGWRDGWSDLYYPLVADKNDDDDDNNDSDDDNNNDGFDDLLLLILGLNG